MSGQQHLVRQRPAAGRWSMPDRFPLSDDAFAQLRAEGVPFNEIVLIFLRCRAVGVRIVAQVIGGRICRLWAHPGAPTDFVECDPAVARPVADGLGRLLEVVARRSASYAVARPKTATFEASGG